MDNVRVKICGITDFKTAMAAVDAGADALGFVFAESPRKIDGEKARSIATQLPPFVAKVGVFVDAPAEVVRQIVLYCGLDAIQLHGNESPEYCLQVRETGRKIIKAVAVRDYESLSLVEHYPVDAVLADTFIPGKAGGTGKSFNWKYLANNKLSLPLILAGGLAPENVRQAIAEVKPYAVDVSSSVETNGVKDTDKIRAFIRRVKESFFDVAE